MHPSNQRPRKPDKLSQGAHKQTSYPRVQWGNTLDKKECHRPRVMNESQGVGETEQAETEGNARNNQDYQTAHAAGS